MPGTRKSMQARLAALPRQPDLALEGSVRELSTSVKEGNRVVRPSVALWVDANTGAVRCHALLSHPVDSTEATEIAVEALVEALASPLAASEAAPALPGRVLVDSQSLAAVLRPLLRPLGVELSLTKRLPVLEEMFLSLDSYLDESREPFAWGLDRSLLLPLYRAAAGYARLKPWEFMGDFPPINVFVGAHGPTKSAKTLYGCVLGAMGQVNGIAFYFSRAGLDRTLEAGDDLFFASDLTGDETIVDLTPDDLIAELRRAGAPIDELPPELVQTLVSNLTEAAESALAAPPMENALAMYFDTAEATDDTYLDWIERQELPLATVDDVPTFVRTTVQGNARLPNKKEVVSLTLAVEAVNGFIARHEPDIKRVDAGEFYMEDPLTAGIPVSGGRTIEVSWPGE